MSTKNFTSKKHPIICCDCCDFKCCKKGDWTRHILTSKHKIRTNTKCNTIKITSITSNIPELEILETPLIINIKKYVCNCGKEYKHQSSLWNHQQKCSKEIEMVIDDSSSSSSSSASAFGLLQDDDAINNSNIILEILKQNQEFKDFIMDKPSTDNKDSLIMELVKQNQEFKELMLEQNKHMMELAKNAGHNTISHNTTNNNKFNLQLFLNETCKDAMNITEFVNSLVVNFEDLENMGHLGYVEGICRIFLRGLRGVEVTKRPFHCSDVKRETMFVKDLAGWEKENSDNEKLTATIKRIAGKNFKQATAWMANHPKAVLETDSHPHMQYMKMMSQCLGGLTAAEDKSNYNKIIKRVAQEVLIDKK